MTPPGLWSATKADHTALAVRVARETYAYSARFRCDSATKGKRGAARLPSFAFVDLMLPRIFCFVESAPSSLLRTVCDDGGDVFRCGAHGGDDHAKKPRSSFAAVLRKFSAACVLLMFAAVSLLRFAAELLRTPVPEKAPAPECLQSVSW